MSSVLRAEEPPIYEQLPKAYEWSQNAGGNLCGIYSVARALQLLGRETQPRSLWDARYVGSASGSTPQELVTAVQDTGATAVIASNLSCLDLQVFGCPVIANVRSSVDRPVYNHWVCVVADGDEVAIYDGPHSSESMSRAEFLSTWNGVGIVVAESSKIWWWVIVCRILTLGAFVFFGLMLLAVGWQWHRSRTRLRAWISLMTTAVLLVICGKFLFGYSFAGTAHRRAVADSLAPFADCSLNTCDLETLERARNDPGVLIVDARLAGQRQVWEAADSQSPVI